MTKEEIEEFNLHCIEFRKNYKIELDYDYLNSLKIKAKEKLKNTCEKSPYLDCSEFSEMETND